MEQGEPKKAAAVFSLWLSLHPSDWNAADSLAEARLSARHKADATRYYKQSL
jgi:hypothetical protein